MVLFFFAMEIVVGFIPNSYSYKYNFVKANGADIQALAIGHSQLYDGFKPESFFLPAFNLCNSDQDFIDDYYLFKELLDDMPNLKVAILPWGYLDAVATGNSRKLSDRSCFYHKYMHLDYDGRVPLKYRLECFAPRRTWKKIWMHFVEHADIVGCDLLGRRSTHFLRAREHELGYNNIISAYTRRDYRQLCILDEYYLLQIIQLLMKRGIAIVMVSPPYYWNYGFVDVNMEQKRFVHDYMEKLCKTYPIHYLDLESDSSYTYDDFFDETHLSEIGAEKFTKELNTFVRSFFPDDTTGETREQREEEQDMAN